MRHGFLKKRPATVQRPTAAPDSVGTHEDLRTQTMKDAIDFIEYNGQEPKRVRGDNNAVGMLSVSEIASRPNAVAGRSHKWGRVAGHCARGSPDTHGQFIFGFRLIME